MNQVITEDLEPFRHGIPRISPRCRDVQAQTLQAPRHLGHVQAAAVVLVHGFEEASAIGDAHPEKWKIMHYIAVLG